MTISCTNKKLDLKRKEPEIKSNSVMRHCKPCKHSSDKGNVDDGVKRFHGDGLVIRMHSNHHVLQITGDGCRIVLSKNSGSVHVIGDGCRLHVGHNVGDIVYTGDGGQVFLGPDSSECEEDCRPSNQEDPDNVLNDTKEKSQGKYDGKRSNEETRKSSRHPTVTKIITKIQSDGQCVTKRFGDSSLIVNSRGRPTKSVPRTSSTSVESK